MLHFSSKSTSVNIVVALRVAGSTDKRIAKIKKTNKKYDIIFNPVLIGGQKMQSKV